MGSTSNQRYEGCLDDFASGLVVIHQPEGVSLRLIREPEANAFR